MGPDDAAMKLFTNDCILFKRISQSDHSLLQSGVSAVEEWCKHYDMCLNAEKTVLIRMSWKKACGLYYYELQDKAISKAGKYLYLGVTITNNLSSSITISDIVHPPFVNYST